MRGLNDNADIGGGLFASSSIALFLPVALVVAGYGILLAGLILYGIGDGAIARLCTIVLALAAPFLIAHAVLRRVTTRLEVFSHAVHVHPGFPKNERYVIPYALIRSVRLRRGLGGRLTRSGTLSIELTNGARIAACDLADPLRARDAILSRMNAPKPAVTPVEQVEKPEILRISSA